jgi:hypothetical protein
MASSPSPLPTTNKTNDAEKNESSLIIMDDGHIVWRRSLIESPQEDDSRDQLDDVLKQMGLQESEAAQTELIKKYNLSISKLTSKNGHDSPMLEEVLQILQEWSPKTDLICLHCRWAKKAANNFHMDSLSTLLVVSNQSNYDPLAFLTKVKTLVVYPRSQRNAREEASSFSNFRGTNYPQL